MVEPPLVDAVRAALSDDVRKLLTEQLKVAKQTLELEVARLQVGGDFIENSVEVIRWAQRVRDTETALDPGNRIKAATDCLQCVRDVEKRALRRVEIGQSRPQVAGVVIYHRLEAEIELKRAEGARAVAPPKPADAKGKLGAAAVPARGTVLRVSRAKDDTLFDLDLDLGADAGLTTGKILLVQSATGNAVGPLLGRVEVLVVNPKTSVLRFKPWFPKNDLKAGDTVALFEIVY